MRYGFLISLLAASVLLSAEEKSKSKPKTEESPLDKYIQEAMGRGNSAAQTSPGSLWTAGSRLTELGSDLRSSHVDDLITVVVSESASAVAQGTTKTQRSSSAKASINALGGVKRAAGPLANLADTSSATQLDGEGATSRSTQLKTTLSARVTHILPNGYLVVEGNKEVVVNSERQVVTVRGVVRPNDLTMANAISSDQIAQLEIKVNGKGVVGDAVRRPFILYRILMGLLPF